MDCRIYQARSRHLLNNNLNRIESYLYSADSQSWDQLNNNLNRIERFDENHKIKINYEKLNNNLNRIESVNNKVNKMMEEEVK